MSKLAGKLLGQLLGAMDGVTESRFAWRPPNQWSERYLEMRLANALGFDE